MTLKLNGSSSGSVAIDAPASTTGGADITFKLPVADGTAGQVLKTDASGNLSWYTPFKKVWSSSIDTTSGSEHVLFASIPADCNRFGVGFVEVSSDSNTVFGIALSTASGYGGNFYSTEGYQRSGGYSSQMLTENRINLAPGGHNWDASYRFTGNMEANRVKNDIWSFTVSAWADSSTDYNTWGAGYVDLGGTLTAMKAQADDDFDYGQLRAWYETGGT